MLVLGADSPKLHDRFVKAAEDRFTVVPATSWHWVTHEILRSPVEMLVVDPCLDGEPRLNVLERIRVLFPSIPIVLYTPVTPDIGPVLLRLGRIGVAHIVVAWVEDHPDVFRDVLLDAAAGAISQQLLRDLEDLFETWPARLRWAIESAIRQPTSVKTVSEFVKRSGLDRRGCLRWFYEAQLPPPSTVLTVIRVLYAFRLLEDPGYNLKQVSAKLGTTPEILALNTKMVFGLNPRDLRKTMTREEALKIARERFLSPPNPSFPRAG